MSGNAWWFTAVLVGGALAGYFSPAPGGVLLGILCGVIFLLITQDKPKK